MRSLPYAQFVAARDGYLAVEHWGSTVTPTFRCPSNDLEAGRVTPCAPFAYPGPAGGAHGVTRPALTGFRTPAFTSQAGDVAELLCHSTSQSIISCPLRDERPLRTPFWIPDAYSPAVLILIVRCPKGRLKPGHQTAFDGIGERSVSRLQAVGSQDENC